MLSASIKTAKNSKDSIAEDKKSIPIHKISHRFWVKHANTPKSYILHQAVEEKKNHVKPFTILCFGCHGEDTVNAQLVAEKIAEVAEKDEVLFIIVTGDNFYPKGVSSPDHKNFEMLFEKKFLQFPALKNKIFFMVLGNHDYNFRNFSGIHQKTGIEIAANEIAYTYLNQHKEFDPNKEKYLTNKFLNLSTLAQKNFHWVMPSRFYKIYSPECQTEFYFLDSNTYLCDYLALLELNNSIQKIEKKLNQIKNDFDRSPIERVLNQKKKIRCMNQVYWLQQAMQKRSYTRKIIIQHHPLLTVGKRDEDSDASHYLKNTEILKLIDILAISSDQLLKLNYNDLLKKSFEKDGILAKIDVLIHSHDHASSFYNSSEFTEDNKILKKGFCQLNVGGGGGQFQNMKKFSNIRHIPIYSGYGCSSMTINKDEIIFRIYNVKSKELLDWHSQGKNWVFSNNSNLPVFDWRSFVTPEEKPFYLQVRHCILEGCYQYFDAYEQHKREKNTFLRTVTAKLGTFGPEGRNRTLLLMGALNNPKPISTSMMLIEVCDILKGSTLLLDKIHQVFYRKKFELLKSTFVVKDFTDFLQKFQSKLSLKNQLSVDVDAWEMVDKFEAYPLCN
ncbi:MAG TPA: metallophosphoesterase [Gammaproteobacteria bacterium]|jgi:hypothetical protein|nr:metallophosphoesterase [Gammaproteobacteria bacterium]